MRVLLDTHILLWALTEPRKLNKVTRAILEDPDNEILFSAASIWEIAIKAALKRPAFAVRPETVTRGALDMGLTELPVRSAAAALVADLPHHYRDPFDRLLVAQAIAEPANLYTVDKALARYSELVKYVG